MKSDRERWNRRYASEAFSAAEPDEFLVEHAGLLAPGRGLDLACGRGGNALFLAERGFRVDAVDGSFIAVAQLVAEATRRKLAVRGIVADLDDYPLPIGRYDAVVVFYFFDPRLMPSIEACLEAGGLLVYATYNHRHRSIKQEFNPAYLVPPQGLASYFDNLETLVCEEAAGDAGGVSRLIARKPARKPLYGRSYFEILVNPEPVWHGTELQQILW